MADGSPAAPAAPASGAPSGSQSNEVTPGGASGAPAAPDAKAGQPAASPAETMVELKVNGQVKKVPLSMAVALAQKGYSADEKFQQTAAERRQMNALLAKFKEDPDAFARAAGVEDPMSLYKQRLAEHLRHKMETPEQKELREARQKLGEFEKQRKDIEAKQLEAKKSELVARYSDEYDKSITSSITAAGIPKTPRTVKRMAELAYKNIQLNTELPFSTLAEMVRDEYHSELKELLGASAEDRLIAMLGDDVVAKVQRGDIARRKAGPVSAGKPGTQNVQTEDKGEARTGTREEWKANLEKFKSRSK